eukprot:6199343-Pleurochrysis_carterae.AAC.1
MQHARARGVRACACSRSARARSVRACVRARVPCVPLRTVRGVACAPSPSNACVCRPRARAGVRGEAAVRHPRSPEADPLRRDPASPRSNRRVATAAAKPCQQGLPGPPRAQGYLT